ncbi:hypothetical protein P9112_003960 [Eukaryota sp. TZLM1-RC]
MAEIPINPIDRRKSLSSEPIPTHVQEALAVIPNLACQIEQITKTIYSILVHRAPFNELLPLLPPQLYHEVTTLLGSLMDTPQPFSSEHIPLTDLPSVRTFPEFQPSNALFTELQEVSEQSSPVLQQQPLYSPNRHHARGRNTWAQEEDQLVLEYIAQYPHDIAFKKLAQVLNRREETIRDHWNRVLSPSIKKGHWNENEDRLLLDAVRVIGTENWKQVATKVPRRTDGQCRYRYERVLKPAIQKARGEQVEIRETKRDSDRRRSKKGAWTREEDNLLRQAVAEFGAGNWKLIAARVPGRTDQQCLRHWEKVLNPNIRKGRWEAAEDSQLIRAVAVIGEGRWSEVSRYVPNRTDKQIHLRFTTLKKKYGSQLFSHYGVTPLASSSPPQPAARALYEEAFDENQAAFIAQSVVQSMSSRTR